MTSQNSNVDIAALFKGAADDGTLSPESMKVVNDFDLGNKIQDAFGIPAIEAQTSEIILLTILVDDSSSIQAAGNEKNVRIGYNMILDSLKATKQKEMIQVHALYINGRILNPYMPLTKAIVLDDKNYQANGWTPLYDQTALLLATVMAKTQEYSSQGIPVRAITVIITDGHDQGSHKFRAIDIKPLVLDMIRAENQIVFAMGIDDGQTDFKAVFSEMGLQPDWVLTPKNSAHEIRDAFKTISQSAVRASQMANLNSMGGFGGTP